MTSRPQQQDASRGSVAPPPARVRDNSWTDFEVPALGEWTPRATVTVVIHGPAREEDVALALASLSEQSYPRRLTEIVVAAPGGVGARSVRELDRGVTARVVEAGEPAAGGELGSHARLRDSGVRLAQGEVLILLGAGQLPASTLVEAHARWHHVVCDAVTAGPCGSIGADSLGPGKVRAAARAGTLAGVVAGDAGGGQASLDSSAEPREVLAAPRPDLFRAAAGPNIGLRTDTYRTASGPADEAGRARGPLELAYRLALEGVVFIPEEAAPSWSRAGAVEDAGAEAAYVPVRGVRAAGGARILPIAALEVTVPADAASADAAAEAVDELLAGETSDVRVRLAVDDACPKRRWLEDQFGADPRVEVVPAEQEPTGTSPLQVRWPATALADEHTLREIRDVMDDEGLGALHVTIPGLAPHEGMIEVVATGAFARARRVGRADGRPPEEVLGELFGERWASGVELGVRDRRNPDPDLAEHGPLAVGREEARERRDLAKARARWRKARAEADRAKQRAEEAAARMRQEAGRVKGLEARIAELEQRLAAIEGSRTYQVARRMASASAAARRRTGR